MMLLTTKNIIGKRTTLINEMYQSKMIPLIKKQAIQIDNDIRECIKKEIKEYGSIVKRYGDWAKFINKEIGMAHYPIDPKYPFHQSLFYRGKHIRDYIIKFVIN